MLEHGDERKMTEKLKPCPFCGSTILLIFQDYMIQCHRCNSLFAQPQNSKPKSMISTWNTRVAPHHNANTETCVCCGAEIPEGRQVCPACEQLGI